MLSQIRAMLGGIAYIYFRKWVIYVTYSAQRKQRRSIDLESVVEKGDGYIKAVPWPIRLLLFKFDIPQDIDCHVFELKFPSPLIAAAFKDDLEILSFWRNFGLGGVTLKTLMPMARTGNPRPRLQSVSIGFGGGLLNALGLPGKGAKHTVGELQKSHFLSTTRPTGISLGGNSVQDYFHTFLTFHQYLKNTRFAYFYEINISCPNTPEGQDMVKNPDLLSSLLQQIRQETNAVVSVKLSPAQSNDELLKFGRLVASFPRTMLNLGNTQYKTCKEVGLWQSAISVGGGGHSGPKLFLRTLEMVRLMAPLGLPIIATGGISTPQQAQQILESGATLIGVATALVENPFCVPQINHHLAST